MNRRCLTRTTGRPRPTFADMPGRTYTSRLFSLFQPPRLDRRSHRIWAANLRRPRVVVPEEAKLDANSGYCTRNRTDAIRAFRKYPQRRVLGHSCNATSLASWTTNTAIFQRVSALCSTYVTPTRSNSCPSTLYRTATPCNQCRRGTQRFDVSHTQLTSTKASGSEAFHGRRESRRQDGAGGRGEHPLRSNQYRRLVKVRQHRMDFEST